MPIRRFRKVRRFHKIRRFTRSFSKRRTKSFRRMLIKATDPKKVDRIIDYDIVSGVADRFIHRFVFGLGSGDTDYAYQNTLTGTVALRDGNKIYMTSSWLKMLCSNLNNSAAEVPAVVRVLVVRNKGKSTVTEVETELVNVTVTGPLNPNIIKVVRDKRFTLSSLNSGDEKLANQWINMFIPWKSRLTFPNTGTAAVPNYMQWLCVIVDQTVGQTTSFNGHTHITFKDIV